MPPKRRFKKRYLLLVLLAGLLVMPRCGGPRTIVLEGDIAPNLRMSGSASLAATNKFFLCRQFLFQSPRGKDHSVAMQFERVSPDRYRATFDLRDAPHGGFCKWEVVSVGVMAADRADSYKSDAVLYLKSRRVPSQPAFPKRARSTCYPDLHPRGVVYMSCDPLHAWVDFTGDLKLALDVRFDPKRAHPAPPEDEQL